MTQTDAPQKNLTADNAADTQPAGAPDATHASPHANSGQKESSKQDLQQVRAKQQRAMLAAQQEIRAQAGKTLAEGRKKGEFSLEHVSDALRIPVRYLQKIEAGDMEGLPGAAYYVGFTRSYAKWLGLDADALAGEVSKSLSEDDRNPEYHFVDQEEEEKNRLGFYILAGIGVLFIVYVLWYLVSSSVFRFPSFLSVDVGDEPSDTIVIETAPPSDAPEALDATTPSEAVARPSEPEAPQPLSSPDTLESLEDFESFPSAPQ